MPNRTQQFNCNIWAVVDFGNGPVEIRCTEIGEHDIHRCEVHIEVAPEVQAYEEDMMHRNVFEQNDLKAG